MAKENEKHLDSTRNHSSIVRQGKAEKIDDDEWADIDKRAINSIEQYLSNEVMLNVMEEESAKDLWKKLEKLYIGKNLTNKLHLKK